jgi:hypothetical protein
MAERLDLEFARLLRRTMKDPRPCSLELIRHGWKLVIVGESPPPKQSDVGKTKIEWMASLSGDPGFLRRPFVYRTNVNEGNPGVYRRGSNAPNSKEATVAALSILNLISPPRIVIRGDTSIVFLLLGRAAIAFRMYDGHDPQKYPAYQMYQIQGTDYDHQHLVDRYVIRIPHPSNVNARQRIDAVKTGNILSRFLPIPTAQ